MARAEFHNQRVDALMHVSAPKKETSLRVRANRYKAGLLVVGVGLGSYGIGSVALGQDGEGNSGSQKAQDCVTHVVQPGDTLWDIAEKARPGKDPRKMVGRLEQAHGGPALTPGERLEVCK